MSPVDLARKYASLLRSRLGKHLKKVILYGSQARGDAHEGSDFDILVVLDRRSPELRELITQSACEMLEKYEQFFANVVYDEREWQQAQDFPLGWNIDREGIPL